MLSPVHPDIGTKDTFYGLYPIFFKYALSSCLIYRYLSWEYWTESASILFIPTINCLTPRVYASNKCYLVWPSAEIPASNYPLVAGAINMAQSAWAVPVIIFLMKSLWPGASIIVTSVFLV